MRKRMDASISRRRTLGQPDGDRRRRGDPDGRLAGRLGDRLAIFYGSWRVSIGHGDVGSFVSFLGALLLAYEPGQAIGRLNVDIQNGLVSTRLIYESARRAAGRGAAAVSPEAFGRKRQGRHANTRVSRYRPGEYVIDDLNLVAEPNSTTALVGPVGRRQDDDFLGVIQRFYALNQGRVTIDGQDISSVDCVLARSDRLSFSTGRVLVSAARSAKISR